MIVKKIIKVQGKFAKIGKDKDIQDGDIITILDEGQTIPGQYGEQTVFKIKPARSEEELLKAFNQTSMNNFIDTYGDNTVSWIGKKAQVWVVRQLVQGKMANVALMAPEGWMLDDETGKFIAPAGLAGPNEDEQEDEIKTEDIPF